MTAGILLNLRIAYMCYDARSGRVIKTPTSRVIDNSRPGRRRKANWARPIQKVDEVDPLECLNFGATMRINALIDDARFARGFL